MELWKKTSMSVLVATTFLMTACGGLDEDPETDILDEIILSQLDFEGVYQDEDGLTIELDEDSGTAFIRALGSSDLAKLMKVNDKFAIGMVFDQVTAEFSGSVATPEKFTTNDTAPTYIQFQSGSITINRQNHTLRIVDGNGDVRNMNYLKGAWTQPAPTTGEETNNDGVTPNQGGGVPILSKSFTSLEGDRDNIKTVTFDMPQGAKKLEVTLSEEQGGMQLADLFVNKSVAANINRDIYRSVATLEQSATCVSYLPNRESESCSINVSGGEKYVISIYGYHAYYGTELKVVVY